jgi:phosphoglycerate kinase
MFAKKTIHDLKLSGKTVMVRVDFNVPIKDGIVSNDYRIRQALPTIEHLRGSGAKVVLVSHLGRPKSKNDLSLSLAPVAVKLSDLLHLPATASARSLKKRLTI